MSIWKDHNITNVHIWLHVVHANIRNIRKRQDFSNFSDTSSFIGSASASDSFTNFSVLCIDQRVKGTTYTTTIKPDIASPSFPLDAYIMVVTKRVVTMRITSVLASAKLDFPVHLLQKCTEGPKAEKIFESTTNIWDTIGSEDNLAIVTNKKISIERMMV